MANDTILQIPISKTLLNAVKTKTQKIGFSSIQDYTRFHYTQLLNSVMNFSLEPEPVKLSAKNAKRYDKMMEDIESGKVKLRSAASVDDLMKQLQD
ncbi:hypothetical protein KBC75_02875 [Candidatus Shapirobacteria bacterium]|nr:hypothetical protein [Candidatus Shapirobacteria bacterium]